MKAVNTVPCIMQDKGAWQFTNDLIIRVKQCDVSAITEFYETNYDILTGMAGNFIWKQRRLCRNYIYEFDDLMQQVYVDLPYYDYSSRCSLYYCIVKGSFYRVNSGGMLSWGKNIIKPSLFISYDEPMPNSDGKEDSSYRLDKIAHAPDCFEIIVNEDDRENKDKAICEYLERTIKNPRDLNAIWCQLFTDLPLNQIRGNEYECYKRREK